MWYSLLGDLKVSDGMIDRTPTARRVRTVLALLLINPNTFVSPEMLADELWGNSPPSRSVGTLQTYIYHLRKLLASCQQRRADADRLVTQVGGYMLEVHPDDLDFSRYEKLTTKAREVLDRKDLPLSSALLREAAYLWRGTPLSGVNRGFRLEAHVQWLEEFRLATLQLRFDVDLMLSRGPELISELTLITALNPLDEGLHARLMLALQQGGRRGDALNVFRQLRRRLVSELGIDPSRELHHLHQALLSASSTSELTSIKPMSGGWPTCSWVA